MNLRVFLIYFITASIALLLSSQLKFELPFNKRSKLTNGMKFNEENKLLR